MTVHNHSKLNIACVYIVTLITCSEIAIKNIHEVYIYESKNNYLKIIFSIISILLIITVFLSIFLKHKAVLCSFIVLLIIMLGYLLYDSVKSIKKMVNQEGTLYKNTFSAFFSLIKLGIVLIGIIMYL